MSQNNPDEKSIGALGSYANMAYRLENMVEMVSIFSAEL